MAAAAISRKRSHEHDCDDKPSKRLCCSPQLSSECIRIVTGQSSRTYNVPVAQLCSSSEYFKRIFNSKWWKEQNITTFPLLGTNSEAFAIYAKWLDTGKINMHERKSAEETDAYTDEELCNIARCYKLANFLEDDNFKDAMLDAMITNLVTEEVVMPDLPKMVYPSSVAQSPHRQFVVDCVINTWTQPCFDHIREGDYPHEFLLDMVVAMGSQIRNGVSLARSDEFFKDIDTCKYHEHSKKNAPCYKAKHKTSSEVPEEPLRGRSGWTD